MLHQLLDDFIAKLWDGELTPTPLNIIKHIDKFAAEIQAVYLNRNRTYQFDYLLFIGFPDQRNIYLVVEGLGQWGGEVLLLRIMSKNKENICNNPIGKGGTMTM